MATHKVIQDIEAEDKFVGPLTLKQFIFAMAGMFFGYLNFFVVTQGLAWAMIFFTPFMLFAFFMAVPWSSTQATEIWVLAKLRYHLKPKKRIWSQSGLQQLVTITAPKKIEKTLTKELSQEEVKGRLKALADVIDSRGWSTKHVNQNGATADSDRLINLAAMPQAVPEVDIDSIPDIYDERGGPTASTVNQMIAEEDQRHRAELLDKMERVRHGEPIETVNQAPQAVTPPAAQPPQPFSASSNVDEKLLVEELKAKQKNSKLAQINMHRIGTKEVKKPVQATQPPSAKPLPQTAPPPSPSPSGKPVRPDILDLARNNDLNVATIARQLKKTDEDNEVVINLH